MADKLPAMPFYPGDWFKDRAVAMCRPATRGIWVDLLLSMWTDDRSGIVVGTVAQLASLARCSVEEMGAAIDDLSDTKTATVTVRDGKVTVINRRMRREYETRKNAAKRQRKARERRDDPNGNVESHNEVTTPISISISNSTAVGVASATLPESAEPTIRPAANPPPSMLDFPTEGKTKSWSLTLPVVQSLSEAFPRVDVLAECRKAKAWCEHNPAKRKTARGMERFLYSWMERCQNRGGASPSMFDSDPRGNFEAANDYLESLKNANHG